MGGKSSVPPAWVIAAAVASASARREVGGPHRRHRLVRRRAADPGRPASRPCGRAGSGRTRLRCPRPPSRTAASRTSPPRSAPGRRGRSSRACPAPRRRRGCSCPTVGRAHQPGPYPRRLFTAATPAGRARTPVQSPGACLHLPELLVAALLRELGLSGLRDAGRVRPGAARVPGAGRRRRPAHGVRRAGRRAAPLRQRGPGRVQLAGRRQRGGARRRVHVGAVRLVPADADPPGRRRAARAALVRPHRGGQAPAGLPARRPRAARHVTRTRTPSTAWPSTCSPAPRSRS